jgi:DNA-3-methyladenine glycosylase I
METTNVRCAWPGDDPLMIEYHDEEWGVRVTDDKKLFEFLVLESAQAGLSWRTILHKREGYRKLFAGFDVKKVAKFTAKDVARLLKDPAIIRNRLKIEATINNAQRFMEVQKEFGSFSKYMWGFVGHNTAPDFAKDLKKREFKFLGATTIYAHMQAVGMVNDHEAGCFRH